MTMLHTTDTAAHANPPVLPSLPIHDHPARILTESFEAMSALYSVSGMSGAGKSTWARQLITAAEQPGPVRWRVISVSADSYRRSTPYGLAEQILRQAGTVAARAAVWPANRQVRGEAAATSEVEDAELPRFSEVASQLLAALRRGISTQRRLLIVIDDTQWADDDSIRVLRLVFAKLAQDAVCVVLLGRDPRASSIAESVAAFAPTTWRLQRSIVLDSLDAAGLRSYVSGVHGIEMSLGLAARIHRVSGGVPLLVDQAVQRLRPVWAARAATAPERRARFDEDVTDRVISRELAEVSPLREFGRDLTESARAAVEIAAVLRSPIDTLGITSVAQLLGEPVSVEEARRLGLLSVRSIAPGDVEATRLFTVFHDLFGDDLVSRLPDDRRAAILAAGAKAIPGDDESARHRALLWRLDAAILRSERLDSALLARLRAMLDEATRARRVEHVFEAVRRAVELTENRQPELADNLVVDLYCRATALSALPRMVEWIPWLERAQGGLLSDLALLHVREFRGDYAWAAGFADELLARVSVFTGAHVDGLATDAALSPDRLTSWVVEMHTALIQGLMAPQATPGDYGLRYLEHARATASSLIEAQRSSPASFGTAVAQADPSMGWLPSAHDVLLRATGMMVFGASAAGQAELIQAEMAALGRAIEQAPTQTPTLFDARLIRAGMFSTVGFITLAAVDLRSCMEMLRNGITGWGTGTARAMHIYCQYLLGNTEEVADALEEASVTILDEMDAVARPMFYALRAAIAANAGDEIAWRASLEAAAQVTATSYDTVGAEYELLAHINHARLHHDPAAQLAAFDPEGMLAGRLLRSQNLYAFKVDALATLGLAEEADRELTRLLALPQPGFQPVYGSVSWLEGRVHEAYGLTQQAIRAYRATADQAAPGEQLPAVVAQAALDAGRLILATGGGRQIGRRYLRAAYGIFTRLGRKPEAARAVELMDEARHPRTGASRVSSAPRSKGLDADMGVLTAREREIAVLASEGHGNAEIANLLGISSKTVAFHMGNILRKLGLTSRRQLSASTNRPGSAAVDPRFMLLTRRERQVAELIAVGRTDAEIADDLSLSARTVGGHVGSILGKLGLRSRRELRFTAQKDDFGSINEPG